MSKRKVILDVDTGSDDAVAIMAALCCSDLEVLGVCSVNGNKTLPYTNENTLRVVEYMGNKVPVYKGCKYPLVAWLDPLRQSMAHRTPRPLDEQGNPIHIHPDLLPLPEATIKEQDMPAAMWLVETLRNAKEKITLIPVGPLTNVALALRLDPTIAENIEEIVYMGGGHLFGNSTPAAEFNVFIDPEAAQIVFECGCKITMVPLDATHEASLTLDDAKELEALGTKAGKLTAELIRFRVRGYGARGEKESLAPIHDALCVAYLVDPDVLKDVTFMRVDVDCGGGIADGCTICDTRAIPQKPRNVYVAKGGDSRKFAAVLKDLFKEEL